jgi:hypothetical protein
MMENFKIIKNTKKISCEERYRIVKRKISVLMNEDDVGSRIK